MSSGGNCEGDVAERCCWGGDSRPACDSALWWSISAGSFPAADVFLSEVDRVDGEIGRDGVPYWAKMSLSARICIVLWNGKVLRGEMRLGNGI